MAVTTLNGPLSAGTFCSLDAPTGSDRVLSRLLARISNVIASPTFLTPSIDGARGGRAPKTVGASDVDVLEGALIIPANAQLQVALGAEILTGESLVLTSTLNALGGSSPVTALAHWVGFGSYAGGGTATVVSAFSIVQDSQSWINSATGVITLTPGVYEVEVWRVFLLTTPYVAANLQVTFDGSQVGKSLYGTTLAYGTSHQYPDIPGTVTFTPELLVQAKGIFTVDETQTFAVTVFNPSTSEVDAYDATAVPGASGLRLIKHS
jgi:hypothetical protein